MEKSFATIPQEAEILLSISHPFIIKCFGVAETHVGLGLIMERMGGNLKDFVKSKSPLESLLKTFSQQIAEAMLYLEFKGIVHL